MGEQNANSTITLRMTRMARRRIAGQAGSQNRQQLLEALRGSTSAADIAAGPASGGPGPLPNGIYGMGLPARTPREVAHMRQHVPRDIGDISKAIITEVIDRNWPVSYTVIDGAEWMVEFVTMRDQTMTAEGGAIETAVTWANPEARSEST